MTLQYVCFVLVPDRTASCDRSGASFSGIDIQVLLHQSRECLGDWDQLQWIWEKQLPRWPLANGTSEALPSHEKLRCVHSRTALSLLIESSRCLGAPETYLLSWCKTLHFLFMIFTSSVILPLLTSTLLGLFCQECSKKFECPLCFPPTSFVPRWITDTCVCFPCPPGQKWRADN